MTKSGKFLSGRNSSLPSLFVPGGVEQDRMQVKEDLNFLFANGFISPKYFSKKRKNPKRKAKVPILKVNKVKVSFSDDFDYWEQLKGSTDHYNTYKELAKPSQKNLNHLCPLSTPKIPKSLLSPVPSSVHRNVHSIYLKESMQSLKSNKYRIQKAKECISVARKLSQRFS